jgi:hypothetical protein
MTGRVARLIGGDAAQTLQAWQHMNTTIGPSNTQRIFYRGLPATFAGSLGDQHPPGVALVISYKTQDHNVAAFVDSIPAKRYVTMIYHHEPEGPDYRDGAQFVSEFTAQSRLIRSRRKTSVRVAMCSALYPYRTGGQLRAITGQYLPGPDHVDYYLADVYQYDWNWPAHGLADHTPWLNWLRLVKGRGKRLGISEYGIGSLPDATNPVTPAMRNARIQADRDYLWRTFGGRLRMWCYWWQNRPNDIQSQFTDAPTVTTWRAIAHEKRTP